MVPWYRAFGQLLEYEPRAEEQVPLLITLQEDEMALDKSIASGDTDLGMCACRRPAFVKLQPPGFYVHLSCYDPIINCLVL